MNKIALLLAAVLAGGTAAAQDTSPQASGPQVVSSSRSTDHLMPEDSLLGGGASLLFADYYRLIVSVLNEAFDRDVEMRAVVLPSFSQEYVVGIRVDYEDYRPSKYRVIYLKPKIQLWNYEGLRMMKSGQTKIIRGGSQEDEIAKLQAQLPADPRDIPLSRCEKQIDAGLAQRIKNVWMGVLYETHYDRQSSDGLDGVTYHFSAFGNYQFLSGEAWTPGEDTKPGLLADLAETLVSYCKGNAGAAQLQAKVEVLSKRLTP